MNTAPAKIILFGEHTVVYGYPAVAVPFTALAATADSTAAPAGNGLTIKAHDTGEEFHLVAGEETFGGPMLFAIQLALAEFKAEVPDAVIDLRSTIPIGGGLGSGAAITTALIRELAVLVGAQVDNETLNRLVYETEKLYHGNPSGIDNTTIVFNRPVYFVRGQAPVPLQLTKPLVLVVADSGVQGSTREAVATEPMFERIGVIVNQARAALEKGDYPALGPLMVENHGLLRSLTVSGPQLDTLVTAALDAGAFGAKLSGGGRGGNVIALTEPDTAAQIAASFRGAGAVKTWITVIG
jgi:mevalonate kinase